MVYEVLDINLGGDAFISEQLCEPRNSMNLGPQKKERQAIFSYDSRSVSITRIDKAIVYPNTHLIEVKEMLYIDLIASKEAQRYSYSDSTIVENKDIYFLIKVPPNKISIQRAIHLLDSGGHNYFHFMIELLPKLLLLKEKDSSYKKWPLIVSAAYRKNDNFRELLRLAGFHRLFFMEENQCLEVEELIYVNKLWNMPFNLKKGVFALGDLLYHPYLFELYDRFIEEIEKDLSQKKDGPERIFLTRCNTVNRRYNDLEIEALARQYDFEIVDTGRMSFAEQFQLFRNAAMIAGPTGASWTNLVFAARNAKALCWMSERWGDFPAFSTLAALRGVDLEYIIIPGKGEKDPHHNYYLDPLHFESRLKALIEKGEGSSVKESTT